MRWEDSGTGAVLNSRLCAATPALSPAAGVTGHHTPTDYMAEKIPAAEKAVIEHACRAVNFHQPVRFDSGIPELLDRVLAADG